MSIRNKVLVSLFLEEGYKQEDDEVTTSWRPLNFDIYSDLFPDLIQEAVDQWLMDNTLTVNVAHEVIFAHAVVHNGAVADEHFEPIYHEHVVV